jgi:hypothetical protein
MEKMMSAGEKRPYWQRNLIWIVTFAVTLVFFHICYGIAIIIPTNISWLMTAMHDWGTHYLGWQFYKDEPWQFPIGDVKNYMYPVGTNIGFTDSIPLMAIFFKVFSGILPDDFQYFGLWLLACHLLTAYYAIKIFRLFNVNGWVTFIGTMFLVVNPVLLYRAMHPALCAQWLLLASLYLYFLNPVVFRRKILIGQLVILLLSGLINPYLCCMILGFTVAIAVKLRFFDRVISWKYLLGYLTTSALLLLLSWYIVGMFRPGGGTDLNVSGGYGLYGFNLNSFFNSSGFSAYFPALKWVSPHQYEGYMYLGLGMMILICILIFYRGYRIVSRKAATLDQSLTVLHRKNIWPLVVLMFLFMLFAITHVVSINDRILFKVPLPDQVVKFGEVFRASSRFFWPVYYLLFVIAIVAWSKMRVPRALSVGLIAVLLIVQVKDTWSLVHRWGIKNLGTYVPPIDSDRWRTIIRHFDEVVFYPPFSGGINTGGDYQYFSFFAAKERKPINTAYVPRVDSRAVKAYEESLDRRISDGDLSQRSLYVVKSGNLPFFGTALQSGSAKLAIVDNYNIIYVDSKRNLPFAKMIDSVQQHSNAALEGRLNFEPRERLRSSPKGTIRYSIENSLVIDKVVSLAGWAFLETTQNNKGDSIFFTLESPTEFYMAPAKIYPRADITQAFKRDYLDDAGFSFHAFKDHVVKNEYTLGICIKDSAGRFTYEPLEIDAKPSATFSMPEKYVVPQVTNDIQAYIEKVDQGDLTISIAGWAFVNDRDAVNSKVSIVMKGADDSFLVPAIMVERKDITGSMGGKFNLDNSGFMLKVRTGQLSTGKFQLGILITDKQTEKTSFILTNRELVLE